MYSPIFIFLHKGSSMVQKPMCDNCGSKGFKHKKGCSEIKRNKKNRNILKGMAKNNPVAEHPAHQESLIFPGPGHHNQVSSPSNENVRLFIFSTYSHLYRFDNLIGFDSKLI